MNQTQPPEQLTQLAAQALRNPPAAVRSTLTATIGAAKSLTYTSAAVGARLTTAAVRKLVPPATSVETKAPSLVEDEVSTPPEDQTTHDTRTTAAARKPVNVVQELGLDPAPVADNGPKPNISIDAAADPEAVDVTPADVARAARRHHPPQ